MAAGRHGSEAGLWSSRGDELVDDTLLLLGGDALRVVTGERRHGIKGRLECSDRLARRLPGSTALQLDSPGAGSDDSEEEVAEPVSTNDAVIAIGTLETIVDELKDLRRHINRLPHVAGRWRLSKQQVDLVSQPRDDLASILRLVEQPHIRPGMSLVECRPDRS